MFHLDDKVQSYTCDINWFNKYESAWNIAEKIYAVNVSHNLYNKLMGITLNGKKCNYQPTLLAYTKGSFKTTTCEIFNYISYEIPIINKFTDFRYYVSKKIRFCPVCSQYGYHSFMHQLTFMDKCFIHNRRLKYLCECDESYIIAWKRPSSEPFTCIHCKKRIPYPEIANGIISKWSNYIMFNYFDTSILNMIKNVFIVDIKYVTSCYDSVSLLSMTQKEVLRKIMMGERFESFPEPRYEDNMFEDVYSLHFVAKEIEDYLLDNFDFLMCKQQYYSIERYVNKDTYTQFNFDIISGYYLMGELLGRYKLDRLYPVEFGKIGAQSDYYYNEIFRCINSQFLSKIGKGIAFSPSINDYKTYRIVNYMYDKWVTERYNEIKKCLVKATPTNYPTNPTSIDYDCNYSPFLIIVLSDNSMLLY